MRRQDLHHSPTMKMSLALSKYEKKRHERGRRETKTHEEIMHKLEEEKEEYITTIRREKKEAERKV